MWKWCWLLGNVHFTLTHILLPSVAVYTIWHEFMSTSEHNVNQNWLFIIQSAVDCMALMHGYRLEFNLVNARQSGYCTVCCNHRQHIKPNANSTCFWYCHHHLCQRRDIWALIQHHSENSLFRSLALTLGNTKICGNNANISLNSVLLLLHAILYSNDMMRCDVVCSA